MRINLRIIIFMVTMIILLSHCKTKRNTGEISYDHAISELQLEIDSVKSIMQLSYANRKVKDENLPIKNIEEFYETVNSSGAYFDSLVLLISPSIGNSTNEILDVKSVFGKNTTELIEQRIQNICETAPNILQNENCRIKLINTINSVVSKDGELTLESIFDSGNSEIVTLTLLAYKLGVYKIGYLALKDDCK